ncbi:ribokinase [Thiomonas sp. FB-6]|uniref:ribokinase n=1 Tax=Thiomonas sp. FB-6 TaxID=1158291 RepID=UPI000377931C|nr:ribokinase [Thiomonas sp. FB-6]
MNVVGSINMDVVVEVERAPAPGETVLGSDYRLHPGGKGANQAVAAARLGAPVAMIGCLGHDAYGDALYQTLRREQIALEHVRRVDTPSGAAFITVERGGQNRIVVAPGANAQLGPEQLPADLEAGGWLLLQLEVPRETVTAAARRVRAAGGRVVLNAAPAAPLPAVLAEAVDVLVVNETEAGALLGLPPPAHAEEALQVAARLRTPRSTVIVTLGAGGSVWSGPTGQGSVAALPVEVIDTTACGDAYVGALAWALSSGQPLTRAVELANANGALAATREGAQPSLPTFQELWRFASF